METTTSPSPDPGAPVQEHSALGLADLIEGQSAAHMVVAADDLGWWRALLVAGGTVRPTTGVARAVATALERMGYLERTRADTYRLTAAGEPIAVNRGFVRVVTRGWEPTFRAVGEAAEAADMIAARTSPEDVAQGCTDIARRHPETIAAVGGRLARDPSPGTTIDLGCADAGRLEVIGGLARDERLAGVDIVADVVGAGRARLDAAGMGDRASLRTGSVQPYGGDPDWLEGLGEQVTTAMSFFLLHQLASDAGGVEPVLTEWMRWFPRLRRLVIGDAMLSVDGRWQDKPWFAPTYELYHQLTGVELSRDEDYRQAFAQLGWHEVERYDHEHEIFVTTVLER